MRPIRRMAAATACAILVMQAVPGTVRAAEQPGAPARLLGVGAVAIESVEHVGYGEVTLRSEGPLSYAITRQGNVVKVALAHHPVIGAAARSPNNVSAITVGLSEVDITTAPGSRARLTRKLTSITLDIFDPLTGAKPHLASVGPAEPPVSAAAAPASTPAPAMTSAVPAVTPAAATSIQTTDPIVVAGNQTHPAKAPSVAKPHLASAGPTERTVSPVVASVSTPAPTTTSTVPAVTPAADASIQATDPIVAVGNRAGPAKAPSVPVLAATSAAPDPAPDPERAAAVAAVLAPDIGQIRTVLDSVEPAIFVPMDSHAGAAAFRRGGEMVLVFDVPAALSVAAIRSDPVFGSAVVQTTGDTTVIRIPLPSAASLHLARSGEGWEVTAIAAVEPVMGIEPRLVDDPQGQPRMRLSASRSSRVVTIIDPPTGARLLVGTQLEGGQGVAIGRSLVQFSLLPTVQGVVVSVVSDDIGMREDRDGFIMFAGARSGGAILSSNNLPAVASRGTTETSRLFTMVDAPIAVLSQALQEQTMAASTAPILGRSQPRVAVAVKMLGLGMGVEALSVLDVAVADDPPLGETLPAIALHAMAGILAGRPEAAAAIDDPRLNGNDEMTLWRAVRGAGLEEACATCAHDFVTRMPLLLSYPQQLRARLLPPALETMALGGQAAAAQQVLKTMPDNADLDLARGMAEEMTAANDVALATYDRVARRSDRLDRYRALTRSVGIHLARRDIGPAQAADALDKLLYGWRGDVRELALRIKMADLRRQVGQWREAIGLLRDAQAAFPEERPRILGEMTGTLAAMLDSKASERLPPAEFVALYDENADLLREGPWAERALGKLADNLIALDLPARAVPVLTQMLDQSSDPTGKAQVGARLAAVQLSANAPDAAIAALAESDSPALAPDLKERRQILLARADAARGDKDKALIALRDLVTPAAVDLRATILTETADWPAATTALLELVRHSLPAAPAPLDETQQKLVMRLANAATLASDKATIGQLAADRSAAMAAGTFANAFHLLTSPSIRTTADIPRALRELRASKPARSTGAL